jgi:hypothetical protein
MQNRALWLCTLGCIITLALVVCAGLRQGSAQSAQPQAGGAPDLFGTATQQLAEPQPQTQAQPPVLPQTQTTSETQAQTPEQQVKAEIADVGTDPRKKEIADDTANLLKLANTLKAEMDKTSPDTLSVAVVRKAGEIEQLAHKMRTR